VIIRRKVIRSRVAILRRLESVLLGGIARSWRDPPDSSIGICPARPAVHGIIRLHTPRLIQLHNPGLIDLHKPGWIPNI